MSPLLPSLFRRCALGLALCAAGALGCPSKAVAPDRQIGLESELAQIPRSTEPRTTLERSRLLRASGLQEQAIEELTESTEVARERQSWPELAAIWRELGAIHLEQGRPEQALELFAKRLENAAALDNVQQRASSLVDTAYAFVLLEQMGQAYEAVTEARVLGGDELMADPLSVERLGYILDGLQGGIEANPEAKELLERASSLYRSAGLESDAARATVQAVQLGTRGATAKAGSEAAAWLPLDEVVRTTLDPEPEAWLRRYQAEAELFAHTYDRCAEHAEQALTLADRRGLLPVAMIARVIAARCLAKTAALDRAIERAAEAGGIVEDRLRATRGELARRQLGYEAFRVYRLLLSLQAESRGPRRVADAFVTSERARARAHLDAVVRSRLAAVAGELPVSPLLARDRAEAEDRVRQLTQQLVRSKERDVAEKHGNALWALDEIKETIQRSNPLLGRVTPPGPADLAEVRKRLLDDSTLLLSYFVAGEQILLFAVDAAGEELLRLGPSADDVDDAVRGYRAGELLRPTQDLGPLRQAGRQLYDTLLGPVAAKVASKRRLLVIPHGTLSLLPFESLVTPEGRFLVEEHEVEYSLSATLAVTLAKRAAEAPPSGRRAFVGMGDPIYDWASFSRGAPEGSAPTATRGLELWAEAAGPESGAKQGGLERLPGTAQELRAIAKLFGADQKIYLRAEASEELVKKGVLKGARIVHIASHGLMAQHYQALALTLRPEGSEDGFLMNSEIAELELDSDLVVLSACRTGTTRQRGGAEPVAGLALSLRSAGARNVLLSLWSVDDDATADLMMRFYRPLVGAAANYRQSLSDAKRAMIKEGKWAHPFYWAAFVLQGG